MQQIENKKERNTSLLILSGQHNPDIRFVKDITRKENYRPIFLVDTDIILKHLLLEFCLCIGYKKASIRNVTPTLTMRKSGIIYKIIIFEPIRKLKM